MSRYVEVEVEAHGLADILAALRDLGLTAETAAEGDRVMLRGGLECAGQPVDVRLPEGTLGATMDFGLVRAQDTKIRLVCAEVDGRVLERGLVVPLRRALARLRAHRAAEQSGLSLEESVEPDGTRRLVLTRS